MNKYVYQIIDSKGKVAAGCDCLKTREGARYSKQQCEAYKQYHELLNETPPYKIIRYKLLNPEVVR